MLLKFHSKCIAHFIYINSFTIRDPSYDPDNPFVSGNMVSHHFMFVEYKKVILCYLKERLRRLREIRLEVGKFPDFILDLCSESEKNYCQQYDKILTKYSAFVDVNLSMDTDPPKESSVELLILADVGSISTENGSVTLTKGSILTMRRSDAEPLIKQGLATQRIK